ncbi:cell wall-binding protein [Clostridium sp. AM58-1XD]|uniref:N-acetylmuramoyl-L-alanine amidase family protein n=1 Tax=Clostridium sp. AM58-1XD TaxID=2292307 RepID=UPI000E47E786|nr:cell wall-binding protein [Clostridium sp. AM58-1XD]RGY97737.1 cell wall-binding protein [Clostridium sp. AM58-1XD]
MKKLSKKALIPFAAMALTAGTAFTALAATGWQEDNGEWVYMGSHGEKVTDQLKKSGNYWYYLGDDGYMARDEVVEYNENYYYFNGDGVMSTAQWREVDNEDGGGDEPDVWWYYFQGNGKAVKKSDDSSRVKFTTLPTASGSAKFTFDEEGHMLYGWISEDGEMLTDDDAWKEGVYYCQENGNGRMTTGWKYLETEDDEENPDKEGDGDWFYFNTSGKKVKDAKSKTINGRKYRFDENGAAVFAWYNRLATPGEATSSENKYYSREEQRWLSTGWFRTVPGEDVDKEAYDDDEEYWFYAKSDGELVTAQIKSISGHKYGFDVNGEMLSGLYKIVFDEKGSEIIFAEEIETFDDLPDGDDEDTEVYYFGTSPKEGVMKTGTCSIELDGEKYNFNFKKSGSRKGAGINGIDKDSIYIQGRRLEAEEGTKYEAVEYQGKNYLINTSGKIIKNKKNVKDADDVYYSTDKSGVIIYQDEEKQ